MGAGASAVGAVWACALVCMCMQPSSGAWVHGRDTRMAARYCGLVEIQAVTPTRERESERFRARFRAVCFVRGVVLEGACCVQCAWPEVSTYEPSVRDTKS